MYVSRWKDMAGTLADFLNAKRPPSQGSLFEKNAGVLFNNKPAY